MSVGLARPLIGEGLGSAFLLAAVVGSGIMADRLFAHEGLALLANSLSTGAALVMLYTFGSISAHFNPVVTLTEAVDGGVPRRIGAWYVVAQIVGAVLGVSSAHAMFGECIFMWSQHTRTGAGIWFSEFIATFGWSRSSRMIDQPRRPPEQAAFVAVCVGAHQPRCGGD